jgi:hypothetical protein
MTRREYPTQVTVNGKKISKVVIDPHYEKKHSGSINDEVILGLVNLLSGGSYEPETEEGAFQYFVVENLRFGGKSYRLIWLLEKDEIYIGVVNAYRRRK